MTTPEDFPALTKSSDYSGYYGRMPTDYIFDLIDKSNKPLRGIQDGDLALMQIERGFAEELEQMEPDAEFHPAYAETMAVKDHVSGIIDKALAHMQYANVDVEAEIDLDA